MKAICYRGQLSIIGHLILMTAENVEKFQDFYQRFVFLYNVFYERSQLNEVPVRFVVLVLRMYHVSRSNHTGYITMSVYV